MQSSHTVVLVTALAATALITIFFYKRKKRDQLPKEWKSAGKVSKIHLYPLKSGRRIELKSARVTDVGIKQNEDEEKLLQLVDRSFVVFGSENYEFKTARTFPKMVLIEMSVHDESHVELNAPGMRSLYVKIPKTEDEKQITITMHGKEEVHAWDCGDEAGQWISRYIHGNPNGLRIGYHDASKNHRRDIMKFHKNGVKPYKKLRNESAGLFTDLTSILLLNQSSVDDLNTRIPIDSQVTVEFFRPTIVVENCEPYLEDNWEWLRIGTSTFKNVKPCTRCILTTINPETGERNKNREPLKTLETYRRLKDLFKVEKNQRDAETTVMGIHLEVIQEGVINLDDKGLFSDLTAILLLNQSSVDDLNKKIEEDSKVTVENFRPAIVVDGCDPYIEDGWDWIKIGDCIFRNVKPCTRCIFTTINPETAERNKNREPLKTMETYRKVKDIMKTEKGQLDAGETVMGINLEVHQSGIIKLNDEVLVG